MANGPKRTAIVNPPVADEAIEAAIAPIATVTEETVKKVGAG